MSGVDRNPRPAGWKTLLAFAIIYFVWGSTFLAIRIAVVDAPPLILAAMRFVAAGLVMFLWLAGRGEAMPARREWASVSVLALLIFVIDYGTVFWSEQRVPSGLTAVMMATIPAFMALAEIVFLGTQRLTMRLAAALLVGFAGVAILTSRLLDLGGEPVDRKGAIALIVGAASWSIASALAKKLPLPESKLMSSASQMLVGGVLLGFAAAALGEFRGFQVAAISRQAWLALGYLIIFGSVIAFTAYVWLIHHESPTKVGTYAYVNPVIAVVLGYFFAREPLSARAALGSVFVLVSVVLIATAKEKKTAAATEATAEDTA